MTDVNVGDEEKTEFIAFKDEMMGSKGTLAKCSHSGMHASKNTFDIQ